MTKFLENQTFRLHWYSRSSLTRINFKTFCPQPITEFLYDIKKQLQHQTKLTFVENYQTFFGYANFFTRGIIAFNYLEPAL